MFLVCLDQSDLTKMLQRKAFQGVAPQHRPNRAPSARCFVAKASALQTKAASQNEVVQETQSVLADVKAGRREAVGLALTAAFAGQFFTADVAEAITSNPLEFKKELARKRRKIPEEEFKDGLDGLKYYDLVVGAGAEPKKGDRVAIHFDVKFRNVTFFTTRQGIGVTGGSPFGFDVGQPRDAPGSALPGIDLGIRGMRVGGQRRLLVPPALAYGDKGVGEIPPNATLQIDVELLSIKQSAFGTRVKLVEG